MFKWIRNVFIKFNEQGVYVPFARYNGRPSVSLSLLILSAAFVMWAGILFPFEWDRFFALLMWHVTSAVLYYNRGAKISKEGIELSSSKESDGEEGTDARREKGVDSGTIQEQEPACGRSRKGKRE